MGLSISFHWFDSGEGHLAFADNVELAKVRNKKGGKVTQSFPLPPGFPDPCNTDSHALNNPQMVFCNHEKVIDMMISHHMLYDVIVRGMTAILENQAEIYSTLQSLIRKESSLMATVEEVKAAVAAETDVVTSAKTLIEQLVAQVEAHLNDPQALQEVLDAVKGNTQQLSDAVAAGTSAAPSEPTEPTPPAEPTA